MKRLTGLTVFCAAFLLALVLYALTAPEGLAWNPSTRLAEAYLGEVVRFPEMPYPLWGEMVRLVGGAARLSISLAALAAALLGTVVCSHFGWRVAAGASLFWIFLPPVWNRAITGDRVICLAAVGMVGLWTLNAAWKRFLRHSRVEWNSDWGGSSGDDLDSTERRNLIVAWTVLALAVLFALVSLTWHDYRFGGAATAFANGVADAADGRIIVLNGVCDDQVRRAQAARTKGAALASVSLRTDDIYRTNLAAHVRAAFPNETNLWLAAAVGPSVFVDVASVIFPERLYLMNGRSGTLKQWERRWADFKPYLASDDPFVPHARHLFGYEGNALANAVCDAATNRASQVAAFALYSRIYTEIDPGNLSALVNMNYMILRGYVAGTKARREAKEMLDAALRNLQDPEMLRRRIRAAGPIRADRELKEKLVADAERKRQEKVAAGERIEVPQEIRSLEEWTKEMLEQMEKGDIAIAGRIARKILSIPRWRGFVPAHAVLGTISGMEGDYVTSECFFRLATSTTNIVSAQVFNNYADTLLHLGRLDEAEKMARRAIEAGEDVMARLTLAEILESRLGEKTCEKEKLVSEIRELLSYLLVHAPPEIRVTVREMQRRILHPSE